MTVLLYLLFFLSGAAALIYEVAWIRSFSLVFGGSHLAVTTVLAVFMGGLALGGALFGRAAGKSKHPLLLYGALEIGVAASAAGFMGLMAIYPTLYAPLARIAGDGPLALPAVRVLLATAAMIVPTTLMGGTLPLLSRIATRRLENVGRRVSALYAVNTLGAVVGSLLTGFFLLERYGLTRTVVAAIALNLAIGGTAVLAGLRRGAVAAFDGGDGDAAPSATSDAKGGAALVLAGIGVSGFCALGYEVLWTRILSNVVGRTIYGVTIMLVAFLAGIALGSEIYGLLQRSKRARAWLFSPAAFGAVQAAIGAAALAVTVLMSDLPDHAAFLQGAFARAAFSEFTARQAASFALAFSSMLVPATLMGFAFPMAGTIFATARRDVGRSVGTVFSYNTVGAILGAAVSGYALIYLAGIERSLQILAAINVVAGCGIAALAFERRRTAVAVASVGAALVAALIAFPSWGRTWDSKYFAIWRNNQRGAFDTAERVEDALQNTDVLYYHEGIDETISVIRPKGAQQAVIVNGRPEATTSAGDLQCQRALGHVPMLLHPDPRRVFVLGLGTGVTLGSTAIHPEAASITLAEIERAVVPAARTFAPWNHAVLDDPKLRIVFDDGRNVLTTTRERFDVITADPVQPWSSGAAYLFTREYYRIVASRLAAGGIACQWLPLYGMSVEDVRSVVKTFSEVFPHTMVWETYYDAEIVGSLEPIVIDEEALARRLARPAIQDDLSPVALGTVDAFLSHFVMGNRGVRAYAAAGVVNTDDNLLLEFSSPRSMAVAHVMGDNVAELARFRESPEPYLAPAPSADAEAVRAGYWDERLEEGRLYDRIHALWLWGGRQTPEFEALWARMQREAPDYPPFRFLADRRAAEDRRTPRLLRALDLKVGDGTGGTAMTLSAVGMSVGATRGAVVFVDNARHVLFGQIYVDGAEGEIDEKLDSAARRVLSSVGAAYRSDGGRARTPPTDEAVRRMVEDAIGAASQ
jgi:spermidine synthase